MKMVFLLLLMNFYLFHNWMDMVILVWREILYDHGLFGLGLFCNIMFRSMYVLWLIWNGMMGGRLFIRYCSGCICQDLLMMLCRVRNDGFCLFPIRRLLNLNALSLSGCIELDPLFIMWEFITHSSYQSNLSPCSE